MSPIFLFFETANAWGFWIAVVGALSAISVAIVTGVLNRQASREAIELKLRLKELEEKNTVLESEIEMHASFLELRLTIEQWSRLDHLANRLFERTSAERIMFLRGINGKYEIEFVSAVHQIRSDRSRHHDYISYRPGDSYKKHLRRAETEGIQFIDVSELPVGDDVRGLYWEGVERPRIEESAWGFLVDVKLAEGKHKKDFASVATFVEEGYSDVEKAEIRLFFDEVGAMFAEGYEH